MFVMVPPGVPKECVDVKIFTRDLGDLLSSSAGSIGRFETEACQSLFPAKRQRGKIVKFLKSPARKGPMGSRLPATNSQSARTVTLPIIGSQLKVHISRCGEIR